MFWILHALLAALLFPGVLGFSPNDAFWYQLHDGITRVETLTDANFNESLAGSSILVVWYRRGPTQGTMDPTQQNLALIYENMLQMTSQFLVDKGLKVGSLDIEENPLTHAQTGSPNEGSVLVFKQGRPFPYNGYRSADLLLSFVRAVNASAVRVISDKISKKEYDAVEGAKVLAYLLPGTAAYLEYEKAALEMHPIIPFFYVYDPLMLPKVKLTTMGEMYVVKPSDSVKELVPLEATTTAETLVEFVRAKGNAVFSILSLHDLHSFGGSNEPGVYHLLAFSRRKSQEARPFFKALKHVSRQYANDTRLKVTVVDPDMLPMMTPHFEAKYGVDVSIPQLGLINFTDDTCTWMDLTSFSTLPDHAQQRQLIQDWITFSVIPPEPEKPVICLPGAIGAQQCIPIEELASSMHQYLNEQNQAATQTATPEEEPAIEPVLSPVSGDAEPVAETETAP